MGDRPRDREPLRPKVEGAARMRLAEIGALFREGTGRRGIKMGVPLSRCSMPSGSRFFTIKKHRAGRSGCFEPHGARGRRLAASQIVPAFINSLAWCAARALSAI